MLCVSHDWQGDGPENAVRVCGKCVGRTVHCDKVGFLWCVMSGGAVVPAS
jgi:hypothetical protein